jgi:hypothetical protein
MPPAKPKLKAKPRPNRWISGPDEFKHSMYVPWMMARAQANFRGEEYLLTFEEFYSAWKDKWMERGKKGHNYCMTRIDESEAWTSDNIVIMTRKEHLGNKNAKRRGVPRSYHQPKKTKKVGHPDYTLIRVKRKKQ